LKKPIIDKNLLGKEFSFAFGLFIMGYFADFFFNLGSQFLETHNLILVYIFTGGFVTLVIVAIIVQARASYHSNLEIQALRRDVEDLKRKLKNIKESNNQTEKP
jgi:hypothetical protein